MRRLVTTAASHITASAEQRRQLVDQWAGACPGAYGPQWDEQRKAEWPA
jgi:hypothetical protein